ncbi:TonB-dependent Receptor Plug Domain [Fibrobacter sp. UWB15]|uniref:TonB-dependent receptor plug domain-containing protein n=1 Tax=unclassified Fibrobacter TaxID=2634177 RepID=UPI00091F0734|nr:MULTISPECIES: TonB-dependent receptor plug domain-containing protein [unclassified Fibrobacter]PWJ63448.1 TonB-dependent receptor-like protein [Fibrobacter sp. UWB6]SHG32049.1 TonB-dependent Receptor Plug Domain [Fibrobacter sp. UWB8]SMG36009.1 TonB-dependent Receptor Plug Domain [Fibrobacter sp. UWB15]
MLSVAAVAQEPVPDSLAPQGITFNGIVQDSSFAPGEKLNVEILESGEALQTTVGTPFSVVLPEDTLWNICVTNSDTAGAEKEKCYELKYVGAERSFSQALGEAFAEPDSIVEGEGLPLAAAVDSASATPSSGTVAPQRPDSLAKDTLAQDSANKDVNVDALLAGGDNAKVTELKKVVVQLRRRPKRKPGESVVSAKSIKRMPSLAEADVIKSIQALPGVVASSDFSSKIYVRGGAADQNLFLFDNAVVYSPVHFFGLFSTFLVEGIDDVQFYKSGFPAQYGNRLSSVLKMDGRAGGQDSVDEWFSKSSIKISTFAAQLHTEGHQGPARWVVAGRTTYIGYMLDLMNALDVIDLALDYEFTDVQGTFMYNFTDDTRMKLNFYVGKDRLSFDPLYMDWGNVAIPLGFYHRFNGDWDYNATLAFSEFYQTMKVSDLMSIEMYLYTFAGKQWVNYRGIPNHTLTAGYELEYDYERYGEQMSTLSIADIQKPFHHVGYLQDAWKFAPDYLLQYGLRFNYQTAAEHFGVEPRASLSVNIDDDKTVEFYGGYYLQYLNSIVYTDQETLNEFYYPATTTTKGKHVKPASSWLFAAEYSQRGILEDYDATVGVYYKTQSNLNTFVAVLDSNEETASDDFVVADGFGTAEGYSFGYELSLRKDKGWWFGGINWSQSISVMKTDDGSKPYFPSWHQPYALKMDLGINWRGPEDALTVHPTQKDMYVRSSVIMKYSAGMPMSEYKGYYISEHLGHQEYSDETVVVPGSRNGARQTDYFRVDVKAIDIGREGKWNFSWTIINLTDHKNMFFTFYDTRKNPPEKTEITQFPYLPIMLSYEYYF